MTVYRKGGRTYSGAGVLVVENYYMKNGTIEPCVILVKNRASTVFMDFGGSYERKHHDLKETAHVELREESVNLFNIDKRHLTTHVDIPADGNNLYRVHIIRIDGVSRKYFRHNKRLVDSFHAKGMKVPRAWRETEDITHVPLRNINFNLLGVRGQIVLKDIDGNSVPIHGRTKRCLYYSQATIYNVLKQRPLAKKRDITIHRSPRWTDKTYTYHIS